MWRKFFLVIYFFLIFFSRYDYSFSQHSSYIPFLEHKAKLNYSKHHYFSALKYYLKLDSLKEIKQPKKNYKIGICLYKTGNKNQAFNYFKKADSLNGDFKKLHFYLGRCNHLNHNFNIAIWHYLQYRKTFKPIEKNKKEIDKINRYIEQCDYGKKIIKKPENVTIELVGNNINSKYAEHAPVITSDGQVMAFTSKRPDVSAEVKNNQSDQLSEDIYISYKVSGEWSEAENMGNIINTESHDAAIGLSPDGRTLLLYRSENDKTGNIYISHLKDSTWTKPESIGKNINSQFWEPSASITKDEKTIYFSSNMPGGYGGADIYVSHKKPDNSWSKPRNLGPTINTQYHDDAPFITQDGETLYFSSKGHQGMGGFDVFKSDFNEKNQSWSHPENMGYPVNTGGDDIHFVWNKEETIGYFSSERLKGYGNTDIYKIIKPSAPTPEIALKGIVYNYDNKSKNVAAVISLINKETNKLENLINSRVKNGKYVMWLEPGTEYKVKAEAMDFIPKTFSLSTPQVKEFTEIKRNIALKPVKEKRKMVLKNIFFGYDKAVLTDSAKDKLDNYITFISDNPDVLIEVGGHTDSIASQEYNKHLSRKRAEAVVDYMIKKGVNESKLKAVGYGESKPIADNGNPEGRAKNRRTEFKFLNNRKNLEHKIK